MANLLAIVAGGESSYPSLEQRLRAVEGLVQDHETAILELERSGFRLPILPVLNECIEVLKTEEISQHVDVPALHISKEHFEVVKFVPHECAFENKFSPQILDDVPAIQSCEEFTEVERLVPPECASGHKYSAHKFLLTCQFHRVLKCWLMWQILSHLNVRLRTGVVHKFSLMCKCPQHPSYSDFAR